VRSKAHTSQLKLPHGTNNEKEGEMLKRKRGYAQKYRQTVRGKGRQRWDGFAEKVLRVMFGESGESVKLMAEVPLAGLGETELERLVCG